MDWPGPANKMDVDETKCSLPGKPRIILAACGTVDSAKFGEICQCFSEWADIRVVVTKSSVRMIPEETFSGKVLVFRDESEWSQWQKVGDPVLHVDLHEWAQILVIAPLSAHILGKIATGLCDNLLTRIVRVWNSEKPLFVAPSMNSFVWRNPSTEKHCIEIQKLGITIIAPVTQTRATGGSESGAMAAPSTICSAVRHYYELEMKQKKDSGQV